VAVDDLTPRSTSLSRVGAFRWPSTDWRSIADVGVGTDTPITLPTMLPDLSTIDGGTALRVREMRGERAVIAPTEGTAFPDAVGVRLAEVAAGDYTVAVALDHLVQGVTFNSSVFEWAEGLVAFAGTDPSTDAFFGGGVGRTSDALGNAPALTMADSAAGGRDTLTITFEQANAGDLNEGPILALTRVGTLVAAYLGNGSTWTLLRGSATGYAGASLIAVLVSCATAAATTETAISNWLVWDNGHPNAGLLPGWVS